jgi:hypothetical protein
MARRSRTRGKDHIKTLFEEFAFSVLSETCDNTSSLDARLPVLRPPHGGLLGVRNRQVIKLERAEQCRLAAEVAGCPAVSRALPASGRAVGIAGAPRGASWGLGGLGARRPADRGSIRHVCQ